MSVPKPPRFARTGYYHFLGRGDLFPGHPLTAWSLPEWERWLDRMRADGHSRLWLLLNGYTLAYPSRAYPALRDPDARTAAEPHLVAGIVHAAQDRGIQAHAVFTTDGHAAGFGNLHPEALAMDRAGGRGDDYLCLEEPPAAAYLERVFDEAIALCPSWDGVVFHPTESDPRLFNPPTRARYRADTGRDMATDADKPVLVWLNVRYAHYVAGWAAWWRKRLPAAEVVMFNCWWMDAHAAELARHLPSYARVCVWDYDFRNVKATGRPLNKWAEALPPERLLYMPSSGGYADGRPPTKEARAGYARLLDLAAGLRVPEVVFFAGPGAGSEADVRLDRALLTGA